VYVENAESRNVYNDNTGDQLIMGEQACQCRLPWISWLCYSQRVWVSKSSRWASRRTRPKPSRAADVRRRQQRARGAALDIRGTAAYSRAGLNRAVAPAAAILGVAVVPGCVLYSSQLWRGEASVSRTAYPLAKI